jgi:ComF family protein
LTCLWKYEGVVRKAILRLKYNFALDISKELVKEASQKLQKERPIFLKDAILVPIPLFWYRKNWRGFNQTEEVGRGIAQSLSCKFLPNLLTRRKFNSPQTGLSRAGRQRNITGIFDISLSSTPPLDGAKIILFDDVWTTGSTLREASRVLKRKGVGAVWGLTLAR